LLYFREETDLGCAPLDAPALLHDRNLPIDLYLVQDLLPVFAESLLERVGVVLSSFSMLLQKYALSRARCS
jgi:hypothetical protein